MTSKSEDKFMRVPDAYASTELSTPKNVVARLISPYRFWEFIAFLTGFVVIGILYLIVVMGFDYSNTVFGASGIVTSAAFGFRVYPDKSIRSTVPSISNVYFKKQLAELSSKIMIYTILASIVSISILVIGHIVSLSQIDTTTRIAGTLLIGIGLFSSYSIINRISSQSIEYPINNSLVSSTFEYTFVLSFIGSILLFTFTSFIYNSDPLVSSNIVYTFVDSVIVIFLMNVVYLWLVSNIE